ncbi:MAG TPA: M23 family metallopeptidase [Ramlibacter sp.]|uniref:M23 family metallopeptidase n=1 Tax=Ramlibacter sp. TaxID=1917967 RepID=UPI002D7FE192|nr:M23 family metallopeptidase [Ramlibacter sp.]HET8745878.1 M23 family metallopeptidase [Ramlibacter sp.]
MLEHHPRQLTAIVAALLLSAGGGAFAVASLGPDPAALPVREILESVQPLPLEQQAEALDAHHFSLYTAEAVRSSDTAESLLARLGVNDPVAASFLRQDPIARPMVLGAPGRQVTAETSDNRNLLRLSVRWPVDDRSFRRLIVERQPSGQFTSRMETAPLVASLRVGSGTIRTNLFQAVDEAGLSDAVTTQLVDIFSTDVDFHRLRAGDRFAVVYETLEADGEPMRTGRVVSAQFVNAGRELEAVWFEQPGQRGGYFDFQGRSLERTFLASPMEITRITSHFSMRFHPIHRTWRAHTGVDYGAPRGAPVRTVGDGQVQFTGVQNGYGNVIEIDHGNGNATLYAHLSRIDVHRGQRVERGQRIGAVGSTGWATGPHLHFEFKENGIQRDPLEVARRHVAPMELTAQSRPQFERVASVMRTQLAVAASATMFASAR